MVKVEAPLSSSGGEEGEESDEEGWDEESKFGSVSVFPALACCSLTLSPPYNHFYP